ncbi:Hsp70 family protein [Candidatus Thiosymbion oneisti]|uniref:Hsp70 family protein n=1 Tax=Candidatus Thiosymbion oneisti TaxID=589554 RepID=UPI000A9FBB32|nr:Hsp70 family protein [Candidatus Thiosymbion oneisti]
MSDARYAVGIDLGTTHCALSYVDLDHSEWDEVAQEMMPVPQLTGPGSVAALPLLPSFLYLPHPDELAVADLVLPWGNSGDRILGEMARSIGARTPIRLVSSAKSWLCHPGIDRRSAVLPPGAPEAEVPRLSPYEASVRYLEHLRDAWNYAHPYHDLAHQEVTVTVPASFDPAARELTAEAAQAVGFQHLVLLEEPQAALYSWIHDSAGKWRNQVRVGDIILVIDVGGGTTDLSLIAVTEREGALELTRVAVGEHILLGGDNMDLALAHLVKGKLAAAGTDLDHWQVQALTHGCRQAKEALLVDPDLEAVPVVVPSRGTRLIDRSLRTELTSEEIRRTLVEGFFPEVPVSARPAARARTALTKLGLSYAQDAAVTRHLAAFLGIQIGATEDLSGFGPAGDSSFLHPTAVLFNGGVFKADLLAERVMKVLNDWLTTDGAPPARLLVGGDLDLSVARGASYYGYVRRGRGVRIRGGTARSYYVGVESAAPAVPGVEPRIHALCLAPFGMEEGTQAEIPPQEFGLVVAEQVRFRFFGSSVRREDQVGDLLDDWSAAEVEELEEIEAYLPAETRTPGEVVPVHLRASVTEVGTLLLEAMPLDGPEHWKVEFNVRNPANE